MPYIMNTKRENKNAYKQMKFRIGIFQIKNLKNNKVFLNTSTDLDRAFNSDLFRLKSGLHSNKELQNDWKELGSDAFQLDVLDELKMEETATEIEIKKELKDFYEIHCTDLVEKAVSLY